MLDKGTPEPTEAIRTIASTHPRWREVALVILTVFTAYTTAISWQAQGVSYPLFRVVGTEGFAAYHQHYNEDILWPVLIPGFPTGFRLRVVLVDPTRAGAPAGGCGRHRHWHQQPAPHAAVGNSDA